MNEIEIVERERDERTKLAKIEQSGKWLGWANRRTDNQDRRNEFEQCLTLEATSEVE